MNELSHTTKCILVVLKRRWRWIDGGSSWKSTAKLAKEIHRTVKQTKTAIRELKSLGIVFYSWMINSDGMVSGSGYFLEYRYDN